jgi:hypothetical protein
MFILYGFHYGSRNAIELTMPMPVPTKICKYSIFSIINLSGTNSSRKIHNYAVICLHPFQIKMILFSLVFLFFILIARIRCFAHFRPKQKCKLPRDWDWNDERMRMREMFYSFIFTFFERFCFIVFCTFPC